MSTGYRIADAARNLPCAEPAGSAQVFTLRQVPEPGCRPHLLLTPSATSVQGPEGYENDRSLFRHLDILRCPLLMDAAANGQKTKVAGASSGDVAYKFWPAEGFSHHVVAVNQRLLRYRVAGRNGSSCHSSYVM